jgi:UDP-glucose 4-epimerase
MSSGKNCLVTGCAGFIGSHLSAALLEQGHTVIGIDNFFSGYPHNMEKFINNPDFYFMDMSIVEDEFWDEIIEKFSSIDVVFHLAAIVSVPYSLKHAETTMETNYASSVKMIEGARSHGVESFIFAGSAAEYGAEVRLPVREEYAREVDDHLSPYGLAKFRTSIYLEDSGYGCSLRFFNVFGPRQDPSSAYSGVISRFIDFGLSERSMVIFGDGLQSRDFIHVSDAVKVYLLAAGLDSSGRGPLKGIYNVGTGKGTSVLELAERVLELTGSDKEIIFKPERAGDIKHSIADISKLEAVGFKPEISLEDGLENTIKWEKVVRRIS